MSLYQSPLRKHINEHIYKKPLFEVEILGKPYFGIVKVQKKFGKILRWYMVHGVKWWDLLYHNDEIVTTLHHIQRDFGSTRGDIFFQFGSTDVLDTTITSKLKNTDILMKITQKKTYQTSQLRERYNLQPSWREHMPNATIILDLTKTLPDLKTDFSSSGKRYFNKAKKQGFDFVVATEKERGKFRDVRYTMSYDKWFHIINKDLFIQLMHYLTESKQWNLVLAKKNNEIVSGSVLLFLDDMLIYLYGATDRSYGNIWSHYRLMYETMRRGRDHHFKHFDLLGVAPPGEEEWHDLQGVTRFKQAFGGETISYVGNYDLVFNKLLYRVAKRIKK